MIKPRRIVTGVDNNGESSEPTNASKTCSLKPAVEAPPYGKGSIDRGAVL